MPPSFEQARYAAMRWNTPLSRTHADHLIAQLELADARTALDLGCGWGELLLDVLDVGRMCRGTGVDTDALQLARGRARAEQRALQDRVRFVECAAEGWREPADRVLCIGASHAWGTTAAALHALAEVVTPDGLLLFGDGFWQQPPTAAASQIFGDAVPALDEMLEAALAAGWRILSVTSADQREWDTFESDWRRGREIWLAANPGASQASELRRQLDERLLEYVQVYRGVLGFAYLVLRRDADATPFLN